METLKQIAYVPGPNKVTVGVVIDSTGIYKTDYSFDFVSKIRVIDDELHNGVPDLQNFPFEKFIQVFIFNSKYKNAPDIVKVGDIILLRNFSFDTYNKTI